MAIYFILSRETYKALPKDVDKQPALSTSLLIITTPLFASHGMQD
jgi:hypothetical protein